MALPKPISAALKNLRYVEARVETGRIAVT